MGYTDRKNTELESLSGIKVEIILENLRGGLWEGDAARMAGVPISTYSYWKKNIPEFKDKVELAILEYKRNLIKAVNVNSVRSGKIALEVLKTRWGSEWNIPKKIRVDDSREETKKQIDLILGIMPEDELNDEEELSEVPTETTGKSS